MRKLVYLLISTRILFRCVYSGFTLAAANYRLLCKDIKLGDTAEYTIKIKLDTKEPDDGVYCIYPVKRPSDLVLYEKIGEKCIYF